MRALKSVLVMAGALKRKNPDLHEDVVLIRAMRDSNVPTFLPDDLELFQNIISDLFPGVEVPYQVWMELCVQPNRNVFEVNLLVVLLRLPAPLNTWPALSWRYLTLNIVARQRCVAL